MTIEELAAGRTLADPTVWEDWRKLQAEQIFETIQRDREKEIEALFHDQICSNEYDD